MVERGHNLKAQIFQLGHHGSSTSNTLQPFLDAVQPEVGIYSAGKDNSYGHPHDEIVDLFNALNVPLYGRDTHGTIIVTTDGNRYEIETNKSAIVTTAPSSTSTSAQKQATTTPDNSSGCGPGQVDINSASLEDIKKIKHIDEKRGNELINLRPFTSVDSLTRINGIGDGRLKDIKAEGIACVN